MDAPQTPAPAPETSVSEPKVASPAVKTSKKKLPTKKILMALLALVLLAGAAYGGYWWRDQDAKKDSAAQQAEIDTLEKRTNDSKTSSKTDATSIVVADETSVQPTSAQLENIKESISSGNTATLESRMADSVTVILAASEGLGTRTPTQAISDIDYVIDLDATWDFALSTATLNDYATGDYAQYFPDGALVGKSSAGKVISFIFDANSKIKTVFMSPSADPL